MSEKELTIKTVLEKEPLKIPYTLSTTAEDVCIKVCKRLNIGPLARHIFALRTIDQSVNFLIPSDTFTENNNNNNKPSVYEFLIRFKVANIHNLNKIDPQAYNYYFHQIRRDVLDDKVPDLFHDKYKQEIVGLAVTDMYRVVLETNVSSDNVQKEYKKFLPKNVLRKHYFFLKRPIRENLAILVRTSADAAYVKEEYIKHFDSIAPEYLFETYDAIINLDGTHSFSVFVKVCPSYATQPGIKYCLQSKRDEWTLIATLEDIGFISIRDDNIMELRLIGETPFQLRFKSKSTMFSFISLIDGYYRLTCKWTFNVCKEVSTPSLKLLHSMKCHGPIGGEFSYSKLEAKQHDRLGSFIIRESETSYNIYYIDVCLENSSRPRTFKVERKGENEFIFNDNSTVVYKTMRELVLAYSKMPIHDIFLKECIPPSEYDISNLLLCRSDKVIGDAVADSSSLNVLIPHSPQCINYKDLQVYKGKFEYFLEIVCSISESNFK